MWPAPGARAALVCGSPAGRLVTWESRLAPRAAARSPGGLAPWARKLKLRLWFDLGVVVSLALGLYACVLLATEAAVLLGRLGLLPLVRLLARPAALGPQHAPAGCCSMETQCC